MDRIEINYDLADMCFQQMKRSAAELEENTEDVEYFVDEIGASGWSGEDYEAFRKVILKYNKKLKNLSYAMTDYAKKLEDYTDNMYENELYISERAQFLNKK